MNYWLVKTDPDTYSWNDLVKDRETVWDGVRNYQARNNLKLMKLKDKVLVYHSQIDKAVMGIATVSEVFFQDPSVDDENWVAVKIAFKSSIKNPVTLEMIKSNEFLQNIALIRQSRLSVMPLNKDEFDTIINLSK